MLEPRPPSSTLPWPFPSPRPGVAGGISAYFWRLGSRLVISSVSNLGTLWIKYFNRCQVINKQPWVSLVESHPSRPLLSISNHASCLDDPFIHGQLPLRVRLNPGAMRWSLGADDVCFRRPSHARFFALGQTAPVIRGNGVHQRSVDFIVEKLDQLKYVHLYPEGKVNMTTDWLGIKWGVAKMIVDAKVPPIVIPIWHEGFEEILPNFPPYIPQVGKKATLVFGEPFDTEPLLKEISDDEEEEEVLDGRNPRDDLFKVAQEEKIKAKYGLKELTAVERKRKRICDHLENELKKLRLKTHAIHFSSG